MLYINKKVSTDKLLTLLKKLKEYKTEPHQMALCKDEEILVQFSPEPYVYTDKQVVYSVSKSFTSTAVGMCYDKGLLHPEDKIIRFFPEEITKNADERIKRLTVKNLLCMNTAIVDRMVAMESSDDPVFTFFNTPVEDMTDIFHYSNAATFMLSAIVTQLTGLSVFDLLNKELFPVLGIHDCRWVNVKGFSEGYSGFYCSASDIALTMQIYLNHGMFGGKRLLSDDWVKQATAVQISTTGDNPYVWWTQGYGYQFWKNFGPGCRANGAIGQTGYIFPDCGVTLGQEGIVGAMDETDEAYHAFCKDFGGESTVSIVEIEKFLAEWFPTVDYKENCFAHFGQYFFSAEKDKDLTTVVLQEEVDSIVCLCSNGYMTQKIYLGKNQWKRNRLWCLNPALGAVVSEVPREDLTEYAASCTVVDKDTLKVSVRFTNAPINREITLKVDGDTLIFDNNHGKEFYATLLK